MNQAEVRAELEAIAEHSYDRLAGKWLEWLEVAKRFEHKAKAEDRLDLRHNIIVAFADQQARNERLGNPDLSFYGMLRIASHCVADYWREINKATIKVCILSGLPRTADHKCSFVGKPSKCSQCPFIAVRPIESLNTELQDIDGNMLELIDILADDKAIDLDLWLDDKAFLLGCPDRLIKLAVKKHKGIPLNDTEQRYFTRQRQKELKRYQKTLF